MRPIKIGIALPFAEGRMAGKTPHWSDMLAMAQRAEQLGFDSVWVPDHLIFREPDQPTKGAWECWSLLAALAAATNRVELGPLVSCTSFRNPALLAKMADTVDEISGGRLILGLGAGWHEPEYRAFGFPFDHRISRFEEAVTIIHTLLHQGEIDFQGRYYQLRECELRPRGPRPDGPPILIAATGRRMLGLTARYADAWNLNFPYTGNRIDGVPPFVAAIDDACRDAGRDPSTLERTAYIVVGLPGRTGSPGNIEPLLGSPEELAEEFRAYARAGFSHLQVWLDPRTIEGMETLAPALEFLDKG